MTPRIDAHHHLWHLDRPGQSFPTPGLRPIWRDFGMADLLPHLERHAIDATILVQVCEDPAETDWMLRLARAEPRIAGVVGWLDLEAPDAPAAISAAAADPLLVGLRPMVQDMEDDRWFARASLIPAFGAMARHGLVLDGLVRPRHLSALREVAQRHPDLRIVLDHCGKPDIAARQFDSWRVATDALAALPNVACKLSGLVTEAAPEWQMEDLRPVVSHVLGAFGAERVLWGSDWPVVELAGGYGRWTEAAAALLRGLTVAERAAIFGATAAQIYLGQRGRRAC